MKLGTKSELIATVIISASGCSCQHWISDPMFLAIDPQGRVTAVPASGDACGTRLVPKSEINVRVIENRDLSRIVISSNKWKIEGCGTFQKGNYVEINSICGKPSAMGGEKTIEIRKINNRRLTVRINQ